MRGIKNGVKNLEILDKEVTLQKEPNLKKDIKVEHYGLFCRCLLKLLDIALSAAFAARYKNGAEVLTKHCTVNKILTEGDKALKRYFNGKY